MDVLRRDCLRAIDIYPIEQKLSKQ